MSEQTMHVLAGEYVCPHITDGRRCDGKDCILWSYLQPLPELDANGDVAMVGEGWVCGMDTLKHVVATEASA